MEPNEDAADELLPTPLLSPAPGIEPDWYGTMPMDGRHLSQLLDAAAARRPDHAAVEDEHGRTLSFAALAHGADRLATRLARWGVGRGDRVGLWLPKSLRSRHGDSRHPSLWGRLCAR